MIDGGQGLVDPIGVGEGVEVIGGWAGIGVLVAVGPPGIGVIVAVGTVLVGNIPMGVGVGVAPPGTIVAVGALVAVGTPTGGDEPTGGLVAVGTGGDEPTGGLVGVGGGGEDPIKAWVDVVCLLANWVVLITAVTTETRVIIPTITRGIRGTAPEDQKSSGNCLNPIFLRMYYYILIIINIIKDNRFINKSQELMKD